MYPYVGVRFAILHLSDLHRDSANPIGNQPLLDSLENDRQRYTRKEDPTIRSPDIVVVSGDIIQGVAPDVPDPKAKLRMQYEEALAFLGALTDRFAHGDRNRVVIVPGNHDVSASHVMESLTRVGLAPDRKRDLVSQLFSPLSRLRWSWPAFELYEITDQTMYAERLAAFSSFYEEFYKGARRYSLDATKQLDIFDYPDLNLSVTAFSSCYNNDILNGQGAIHPECIAEASNRLRKAELQDRLRIAVWHHNTEGVPSRSNYMDPDILQNLIERGFSLGLHGHQHRPQFLDTKFRYGGDRRITVISAGTLCGGPSFRFGRAYNIIEVNTDTRTGRLHLREMQNDDLRLPIWGRRSLPAETGAFLDFKFDAPPEPPVRTDETTTLLIRAQRQYDRGEYQEAATTLTPIAGSDDLARRLLLECLRQLGDTADIVARFDPPVSSEEAITLIDALWREGKRDRLLSLLSEPVIESSSDPSVVELRSKYLRRLSK